MVIPESVTVYRPNQTERKFPPENVTLLKSDTQLST